MTRYRSTYRQRRPGQRFLAIIAFLALLGVCGYFGYAVLTRTTHGSSPARSFEQYVDAQQDAVRIARSSFEDEAAAREVCGEYAIEAIGPDSSPRGWRCPEDTALPP